LVGMLIIVVSVLFEGSRVAPELKGDPKARYTVIQPRIFEAIGVIRCVPVGFSFLSLSELQLNGN
jgi:hypothetical protein